MTLPTRNTADSAARWLARAILAVLGVAALWALFAFKLHNETRAWPLVTSHHTSVGVVLVEAALFTCAVMGVGYAIYALVRAARS